MSLRSRSICIKQSLKRAYLERGGSLRGTKVGTAVLGGDHNVIKSKFGPIAESGALCRGEILVIVVKLVVIVSLSPLLYQNQTRPKIGLLLYHDSGFLILRGRIPCLSDLLLPWVVSHWR